MTFQEACRILDLGNPRTFEEVKEAYNVQVKAWHPDRFEGDHKMHRIGTAKMKLINEAFRFVKENWSGRGPFDGTNGSPVKRTDGGYSESTVKRKTGPRDILTVVDGGMAVARKNKLSVAANRVHEYLGDAVLTISGPGRRPRELVLKVGESAVVDLGRSSRCEVRLLQVRKVYKVRRGMMLPQARPAADVLVTGIG